MFLKRLQVEANYLKAAQFIQRAASLGAQLAVLPEYHLTNWVPEDPGFASACDQWHVYLEKYRSLAKEHNICIVPGTIVERHQNAEKVEDKLINVAYFIDNRGEVLGSYQKKNLWYDSPLFPRLIRRYGNYAATDPRHLPSTGIPNAPI